MSPTGYFIHFIQILGVSYEKRKGIFVPVSPGRRLSVEQTQSIPFVSYPWEPGHYYSLLMIDPDAPSRKHPVNAEMLHWMVVNISRKTESNDLDYATVMPYRGPNPGKGTGLHRYIFLLFRQARPVPVRVRKRRSRFDALDWSRRVGAVLVAETSFVSERPADN